MSSQIVHIKFFHPEPTWQIESHLPVVRYKNLRLISALTTYSYTSMSSWINYIVVMCCTAMPGLLLYAAWHSRMLVTQATKTQRHSPNSDPNSLNRPLHPLFHLSRDKIT